MKNCLTTPLTFSIVFGFQTRLSPNMLGWLVFFCIVFDDTLPTFIAFSQPLGHFIILRPSYFLCNISSYFSEHAHQRWHGIWFYQH